MSILQRVAARVGQPAVAVGFGALLLIVVAATALVMQARQLDIARRESDDLAAQLQLQNAISTGIVASRCEQRQARVELESAPINASAFEALELEDFEQEDFDLSARLREFPGFLETVILDLASGEVRLLRIKGVQPVMSPGDAYIAFIVERYHGCTDLHVLDMSTGVVSQITDDLWMEGHPRWSPDGLTLAFDSDRSGNREIWLVNADGTGFRQLTDTYHPVFGLADRFTGRPGQWDSFMPRWTDGGEVIHYCRKTPTPWDTSSEDYKKLAEMPEFERRRPASGSAMIGVDGSTVFGMADCSLGSTADESARAWIQLYGSGGGPYRRGLRIVNDIHQTYVDMPYPPEGCSDGDVTISPTGQRVLFTRSGDCQSAGFYIVEYDGGGLEPVRLPGRTIIGPISWSADGAKLVMLTITN